jgi:FixJ family two-component response regulator
LSKRQGSDLKRATLLIAIIDDDDAVRRAIGRLVGASGYAAALFASADQFLASEQAEEASCIITDVQMPGLSGLDLQDRLLATGSRTPIIFITGLSR